MRPRYRVALTQSRVRSQARSSTGTIQWFENELPLRDPHTLKDKDCVTMAEIVEFQQEVESFGMDWYDPTCHAIKILNAKYEKVQIDDVVNQLEHLNVQQKAGIKQVLSEFTKLFDGTLGVYPQTGFDPCWSTFLRYCVISKNTSV